jgi:competence protein ComEC
MLRRLVLVVAVALAAFDCGGAPVAPPATPPSADARATKPVHTCAGGPKLKVHFYDVAQALAALVELPDGRHILVDTGDSADRAGCGQVCAAAHQHLVSKLTADLGGKAIDLMWITHQHSDHIGGALDILERFAVKAYVDNGRDLTVGEIKKVRDTAKARGVSITVVEPGRERIPLESGGEVKITAIAPSSWLPTCKDDRNDCSILLRLDYCASSILFTGDAEKEEEALLDPRGPATLLQVGHHGSDTSSSAPFIAKVQPRYAVISAGKEAEGTNRTYCHPLASTVETLTRALGGAGGKPIHAFDAKVTCKKETKANWIDVPASDRLWATERDGDVVLTTTGDGHFVQE